MRKIRDLKYFMRIGETERTAVGFILKTTVWRTFFAIFQLRVSKNYQ